MSFWNSEKIVQVQERLHLVEPFRKDLVKHAAYELVLGTEAFRTCDDDGRKTTLQMDEQLVIPPGQFGLLITEETVRIPDNAVGFISIKAGIKFRGLVNVSGFHVDPGFTGRLKFSVYNAGSQNVVLQVGRPTFLLWFSDLDGATQDLYSGKHANQSEITSEDVMRIQGEIASPGQLQKDIQALTNKIENLKMALGVVIALGVGVFGFAMRGCVIPPCPPAKLPTHHASDSERTNAASEHVAAPSAPIATPAATGAVKQLK